MSGSRSIRSFFGVVARAGAFGVAWAALATGAQAKGDVVAAEAEPLRLHAVVRDFRSMDEAAGHDDFGRYPSDLRVGLVRETLGYNGKPVLRDASGLMVVTPYRDAEGRTINPAWFDARLGDVAGELAPGKGTRIYSAEGFGCWFRCDPLINAPSIVSVDLMPDAGGWVLDVARQDPYRSLGGFFPINGSLLSTGTGQETNRFFTVEIETEFERDSGEEQLLRFAADDDLWVFIDGRLVVDLGSTHARTEQVVDLERLDWLEDGEIYQMKLFWADRGDPAADLMIRTTLPLRTVEPIDAPVLRPMFVTAGSR
ncbi:MAG: fibro-slime domain-containing protein [Planctomycetota bacterium]